MLAAVLAVGPNRSDCRGSATFNLPPAQPCDKVETLECSCGAHVWINDLLARIDSQRLIVDQNLTRPARWRGLLRRQLHGRGLEEERQRYATAYDELIEEVCADKDWGLDSAMLRQIHQRAVGGYLVRTESLRAGRHNHVFPEPEEVPDLLEELFEFLRRDDIHPGIAATRAHLDLLTIHPFRDGNGRTARLVATLLLVKAGFRSSLLTAVEQFHQMAPLTYLEILGEFDLGVICRKSCLARLVRAMASNSAMVAWFRARRARIIAELQKSGVPEQLLPSVVLDFEFGNGDHLSAQKTRRFLSSRGERPWHILRQSLSEENRAALRYQSERLLDEERDEGMESGVPIIV